jgi:hypothetical protein
MDLGRAITIDELRLAIRQGKQRKARGIDGSFHEFFQHTWDVTKYNILSLLNSMFIDGHILPKKQGVIVCIPKHPVCKTPSDFRPLTLLNADLKLLSSILANRMKRWIPGIIDPNKFCGATDNNIFGALAAIRETIAHSDHTRAPACILSLDFQHTFDRVNHDYLFRALDAYGFSETLCNKLRRVYEEATSTVQINGHLSSVINIHRSIRQGCPLSMLLFAISINPFLDMLEEKLKSFHHSQQTPSPVHITYADDVTIILRTSAEI